MGFRLRFINCRGKLTYVGSFFFSIHFWTLKLRVAVSNMTKVLGSLKLSVWNWHPVQSGAAISDIADGSSSTTLSPDVWIGKFQSRQVQVGRQFQHLDEPCFFVETIGRYAYPKATLPKQPLPKKYGHLMKGIWTIALIPWWCLLKALFLNFLRVASCCITGWMMEGSPQKVRGPKWSRSNRVNNVWFGEKSTSSR